MLTKYTLNSVQDIKQIKYEALREHCQFLVEEKHIKIHRVKRVCLSNCSLQKFHLLNVFHWCKLVN